MRYSQAILRKPSPSIIHGITSADLGLPDFAKAMEQHVKYGQALESLGLKIHVLEADDRFPDSTFVEDVALHTPHCLILSNPGADTRKKETSIISEFLSQQFQQIAHIREPGTLEGGDILEVGETYFIGISERTNEEGARQLESILTSHGLKAVQVKLSEFLHLKTGVSYLGQNTLLVGGELVSHPAFENFEKIRIDPDETYAANSLWINEVVLMPLGFPKSKAKILATGRKVLELDVSEFEKVDGGLSCLSIRY